MTAEITTTKACGCWHYPVRLHDGHCCFTDASICHPVPEDMRAGVMARLRAAWDAPFLADPADKAANAGRAQLTRYLADVILSAPLADEEAGTRTRVGEMFISDAGWSRERGDAANAVAEPGTPEWEAALGAHERVTLTGDGNGANRGAWCTCPNDEVSADQWVRYEHWTAGGCMRHGYVHSVCRRLLQTG